MTKEKEIAFEPPHTLLEMVREAWVWRQHRARIEYALKDYFGRGVEFQRPITSILYRDGQLIAYKDSKARWFDVTDW